MADPITAIAISGVGSAAAGVAGAKSAADGQAKAASASLQGTREQIAFNREIFEMQREDAAPWRELGVQAIADIKTGIANGSFSMDGWQFEQDPGYEFRRAEGEKALNRSAAVQGNLLSGNQMKNLLAYNQNYASDEYSRAYAREAGTRMDRFNILAGAAGMGQSANSEVVRAADAMGARTSGAMQNHSNVLAQTAINAGQIKSNMYGNVAGAGNQAIANYLTYKMVG